MPYAFGGRFAKTFGTSAVANTNAPTFAGVTGAVANSDGSITASWALATGLAPTPIRYIIYAALGSSVAPGTLFTLANIVGEQKSSGTTLRFYQLGDLSTFLVNGATYTVGVRAFGTNGIVDTNTVTVNATAIGATNLPSLFQTLYANFLSTQTAFASTEALLTTDRTNLAAAVVAKSDYRVSFFCLKFGDKSRKFSVRTRRNGSGGIIDREFGHELGFNGDRGPFDCKLRHESCKYSFCSEQHANGPANSGHDSDLRRDDRPHGYRYSA